MSSQNPTPGSPSRRRRIAGERKGARPAEATPAPVAEDRPAEDRPAEDRPAAAPPPPKQPPATVHDDEPDPPREPRAVSTPALVALAVAAVVLVAFAASGFFIPGVGLQAWRTVDEHQDVASAQRTAPAAAERAAAAILSYSYESLEADRDNAARFMTEDYRTKYLDTFGLVLDNAPKVKAVVEAEVKASGVVHADADRADVLVFVDQVTTSTANQGEPQPALNRVKMTMQQQDGTWLVDDITSY